MSRNDRIRKVIAAAVEWNKFHGTKITSFSDIMRRGHAETKLHEAVEDYLSWVASLKGNDGQG